MQNLYPGGKERVTKALSIARERLCACMESPDDYVEDPITMLCALLNFHVNLSHQCYWNDQFCIAVMCGLDWPEQQLSAWCVVNNGVLNYWELRTHKGFFTDTVLEKLGIPTSNQWKKPILFEKPEMYCHLSPEVAQILIEKFDLPTTSMGVKSSLTEEESRTRVRFNEIYPYYSVL